MKIRFGNIKLFTESNTTLGNVRPHYVEASYRTTLVNSMLHNTWTTINHRIDSNYGIEHPTGPVIGQFVIAREGFYNMTTLTMLNSFTPAAGFVMMVGLYINGVFRKRFDRTVALSSLNHFPVCSGSLGIYLNKGDVVSIQGFQNSGATRSIYNASTSSTNASYTRLEIVEVRR